MIKPHPLFDSLKQSRVSLLFLTLWLLTMISLPVIGWVFGEAALIRGMSFGVLMQGIAVLAILARAWGIKMTARVFIIVGVLSYFAELIGSTTGFPFGKYHYTAVLQPQLGGVPLLIPLAWMMMLPPAWAIADLIIARRFHTARANVQSIALHAFISALAFTAWDLFLDPQMTGWGFWVWEIPGQYFGIPLINFAGWMLVSGLLTLAVRPKDLPVSPLALVYILTWLLQTIGQGIFWNQPAPAAFGFLGMGLFVLLAFKRN